MANEFVIKKGFHSKANSQVTGSLDVSGALTAGGSVIGSAFPFTGDASITGSLTVSGSFHAFRIQSTDVLLGEGAGNNVTVNGNSNVMIGYNAGYTNTIGDGNVCIGHSAGYALSTNASDQNVFIGQLAGAGNTSPTARMSDANYNIGIGIEAMLYNIGGDYNISLGYRSMRNINNGTNNTALGNAVLYNTTDGDYNIGLGYYAGLNQTTGNGNITLGSGSLGIAGESNQLRIGNGNSLTTISASLATGDIIFPSTASAEYFVGDGSQLTGISSDPFPHTGDAVISGSLTVTGSLEVFGGIRQTSGAGTNVVLIGNGATLGTTLNAEGAVAIGDIAFADMKGIAIGEDAKAGLDAIAIGAGAGNGTSTGRGSVAIGLNAINNSAAISSITLVANDQNEGDTTVSEPKTFGVYLENSTNNAPDLKFIVGSAKASYWNGGGYFGLGKTTPTSTLDVSGSAQITGSLDVSGAVSKGSGTFKIPHPVLDSGSLFHSFIEGPKCDLIYRGQVDLVNGAGNVNIDSVSNMTEGTFEALTQNPQIFLQNVTEWDPVKGMVSGNILSIWCKSPLSTDTISWMVVAERADDTIKNWNLTDSDGHLIPEG